MLTTGDIARQFDRTATAYVESVSHAKGKDLEIVKLFAAPRPDMTVLDVATGGGHTALMMAPHVCSVTAIDIAAKMLEKAAELALVQGCKNIHFRQMNAESLDLPDETFDLVTCRIAPHHFLDLQSAVHEFGRVLKVGGALVIEDSCAPDDEHLDLFINTIERLRDSTHRRSYTWREWAAALSAAGLQVSRRVNYRKTHPFADWVARSKTTSHDIAELERAFNAASCAVRDYFEIVESEQHIESYTDDKVILRAEKPKVP